MPVDVVNGTPIAYDEAGTGETVVLVHGSWNQRQAWGFVVPQLADSFRVVTYDRRGHGDSEARPDAGTVHDDVADLAALIETLHAAPAYVAGNSFGACIALRLAADRSALVKKVVAHEPPFIDLLDASPDTRPMVQATKRELDEVRARLEAGDHERAAEYFVEHVALGPGAWQTMPSAVQQGFVANAATYLGELADPDASSIDPAALALISAPSLLTQGDQSPRFFAPLVDVVARAIPDARRHTFEGAGHVPHVTHPDDYATAVRGFLGAS